MKLHLLLILLLSNGLLMGQALIITEIFADPTPSRGLPEREYIELLNRSEERLALKGYQLTHGTTRVALPEVYLDPGEYAIACRTTYAEEFAPFGRVIRLSSLSLNNNGTTLVLSPPAGGQSHRVSYKADWYARDRTEGYSLEMMDTAFPCRGKENWSSSIALHAGTPGKANSIAQANPDDSPPKLRHYDATENQIILVFNEVMNEDFATNPYHFDLPGNRVVQCSFADETHESVLLLIEKPLPDYAELRVYAPRDCSGNEGPEQVLVFETLPHPRPGEISLSEVLFNPLPGGDDFVEIHNTSDKRFQLKNWHLARLNALGEVSNHVRLPYTVLPAHGWLALTRNREFLRLQYPQSGAILELPALPPFNNDVGTVLLLKPDSTVFDRFSYSEKMHAALIHHPQGISLEKLAMDGSSWSSASADAGYATPGSPNSRWESQVKKPYFEAIPLVFYPASDTPVTWLTYRLTTGEAYASITIADRHGRAVRTLARNQLLGTQGEIPWDGCDDHGLLLPAGNYAFIIEIFGPGIQKTYYSRAVMGEK